MKANEIERAKRLEAKEEKERKKQGKEGGFNDDFWSDFSDEEYFEDEKQLKI